MLADAEEVDAELVGKDALLDHVRDDARVRQLRVRRVDGHIAERIQAELDLSHVAPSSYLCAVLYRTIQVLGIFRGSERSGPSLEAPAARLRLGRSPPSSRPATARGRGACSPGGRQR